MGLRKFPGCPNIVLLNLMLAPRWMWGPTPGILLWLAYNNCLQILMAVSWKCQVSMKTWTLTPRTKYTAGEQKLAGG